LAENLRQRAQVRSTHYSTRIEGNRLTLNETEQVVQQRKLFPGRERDVLEVERFYSALQTLEGWVDEGVAVSELRIRRLHAMLYKGPRARPTPYRDGQNVIRDNDGQIAYMPPEAKDVPPLMAESADWIKSAPEEYPLPVVAGVAHYQFETVHPFYDGNGRTGRLLTTWILYRGDYDLGRFYTMEEFYAQDTSTYYQALTTHPHHNYYFGRNEADITPWLEYFLGGMAAVFERVAQEVSELSGGGLAADTQALLRNLGPRARRILALFVDRDRVHSKDVAGLLGISQRQARNLLSDWVDHGLLEVADPSKKARSYSLASRYHPLVVASPPEDA
jgi:Fic family protein